MLRWEQVLSFVSWSFFGARRVLRDRTGGIASPEWKTAIVSATDKKG